MLDMAQPPLIRQIQLFEAGLGCEAASLANKQLQTKQRA
jgi:hypothetical protein